MNNTDEIDHTNPISKSTEQGLQRPRQPLIAALMSVFLPGFGQLYNGQINRGIWVYLCFCVLVVPLMAGIALYLPVALTSIVLGLSLLITLAVWMFGTLDAWRQARRLPDYRLKPWQTNGLYVVVFVVCNILILQLMMNWVRTHQVEAFRIPSNSMSPTVLKGDFLFANKNYNCPNCRHLVSRGDVAIFVYPDNRNRYYIKRVLGLPGDRVRVSSDGLFINDQLLGQTQGSSDNLITETMDGRQWQVDWGTATIQSFETTVASGHAFVLGDNRSKSIDSREFGQVPLGDIVGLSRQVWFSKGADGIRWSRLGTSLQPAVATP